MLRSSTELPLTQRLLDNYLMFGLACIFFCVILSHYLAWQGLLATFAPVPVIAPMMLLLVGCYVLRRTVRLTSEIERQLQQVAAGLSGIETTLRPIAEHDPTAQAWNRILDQAVAHSALVNLESRLNETLAGFKQQKLAQVLDSLSDGVAVTDTEGSITYANRSFLALFDCTNQEDLWGTSIEGLLRKDSQPAPKATPELLNQRSRSVSIELQRGEDLSAGVLRVTRTALVGEEVPPSAQVWTVRDITQQKLAEQTRNQFVFTATHELRTPLANIKAYAETLAFDDGIDLEQQKKFCNTIDAEATRLARFVDELLNINQMEAGSLALSRYETDVQKLLNEVIEKVQPQMTQKDIQCAVTIPPKLPKMNLDKDKIAASLVNLLGNAAKYTSEGGRVRLGVEVNGQELCIAIEDTGIGVSEEELPRIFDKFFRSSDSRVQEVSGSGLGLSFTQEVVRLHGGRLTVHSELNKGTRFILCLPRN